jgi:hypothetical protein
LVGQRTFGVLVEKEEEEEEGGKRRVEEEEKEEERKRWCLAAGRSVRRRMVRCWFCLCGCVFLCVFYDGA